MKIAWMYFKIMIIKKSINLGKVTGIMEKLKRAIHTKNRFKEPLIYHPENRTVVNYKVLKYKTGSGIESAMKIQGTLEKLVARYKMHLVLDSKWQRRELEHFDITDLSEETKKLCYKFFTAIEDSLPHSMTHYKDCYLVVLEEDMLAIRKLFEEMEYPIEDVELEDFKKFLDRSNNHTDYYQSISYNM